MIAGFAGHQDLRASADWVAEQIDLYISKRSVTWGVTALAIGADQLFATKLRERQIPYTAVIPSDRYEDTFRTLSAQAAYQLSLAAAREVERLSYPAPSERAFFAAGKRIVDKSDFLLAVWDGRPARGLGGTGDVVKYALKNGRAVVQLHPVSKTVHELDPTEENFAK